MTVSKCIDDSSNIERYRVLNGIGHKQAWKACGWINELLRQGHSRTEIDMAIATYGEKIKTNAVSPERFKYSLINKRIGLILPLVTAFTTWGSSYLYGYVATQRTNDEDTETIPPTVFGSMAQATAAGVGMVTVAIAGGYALHNTYREKIFLSNHDAEIKCTQNFMKAILDEIVDTSQANDYITFNSQSNFVKKQCLTDEQIRGYQMSYRFSESSIICGNVENMVIPFIKITWLGKHDSDLDRCLINMDIGNELTEEALAETADNRDQHRLASARPILTREATK